MDASTANAVSFAEADVGECTKISYYIYVRCVRVGWDSDEDNIPYDEDICPYDYNPNQEDTYPPGGNGIGDACDCEADFNCDGKVSAADITPFVDDYGRNQYYNPCTNEDPCNGDFDCDGNVDATDVAIFSEDFGRNQYNNPCPACEVGDWCEY